MAKTLSGIAAASIATSLLATSAGAAEVTLYAGDKLPTVVYDTARSGKTMTLAATMLGHDLEALSGRKATVSAQLKDCTAVCIVVGRYDSPLVARIANEGGVDLAVLKGQWERYERVVVTAKARTYVLIAGSDRRGAVYGVVDLSRQLGVSPWTWWADVTPRQVDKLTLDSGTVLSDTPSVQYRGIFLNDEDWGLEPWAAKTLDPKTGNIGPKTYAKVYELMWRLKANTLWPAMHSVSTPFYGDKGNPPLADDYGIVVGTSHAEPMMRNNLREWDEAKRGPFNFTTNSKGIADYWLARARESKPYENIYTVGLRGIHDGPMQGANTMDERKAILQNVVGLQRNLLSQAYGRPAETIPQVYVAYHELQEAYDAGLKLPDDVTLMWADDNYGYIRRFGTPEEQKRSGGSGVYYHLSYWGRPHDYLWLGTTHPDLIHEEMGRAYDEQARKIWIVNVGDIKPIEYLTQYFLDLAFDAKTFAQTPRDHLRDFMSEQFGPAQSSEIADIMMAYYDLAFERKPEFMGFGQTEWVTQNRPSAYVQSDGEEAQTRIQAYANLVRRAEAVAAQIPADRQDAFFELVLYPVRASANLNERILKLDLANLYAEQGRAGANLYVDQARAAHAAIVADTAHYNDLQNGKWRYMMDMAPRRLPVFDEPLWPHWSESTKTGCDTALSGQWFNDHNTLPFVRGVPQTKSVTLFGYQAKPQAWTATQTVGAFTLSAAAGTLDAADAYEQRLTIRYDGTAAAGDLAITCGGATLPVYTKILDAAPAGMATESDRIVALAATAGSPSPDWQTIDGLGSLKASLRARLDLPSRTDITGATPVTYRFSTVTAVGGQLKLMALPTHALTPANGVKVAIQLDGGPLQVVDFQTLGRSDAWRQNVLTNTAVQTIPLTLLPAGTHELKLYALDPGVMIDRIEIDLDGAKKHYGAVAPVEGQ